MDSYLLAKFKVLIKEKYFWLRSVSSSLVSEMWVVLIVILIGYCGVYSFDIVEKMMISDYMLLRMGHTQAWILSNKITF